MAPTRDLSLWNPMKGNYVSLGVEIGEGFGKGTVMKIIRPWNQFSKAFYFSYSFNSLPRAA